MTLEATKPEPQQYIVLPDKQLQKLCHEPTTPTKFMLWLYSSIFEIH
jgi:hypothetical protein